MTGAALSKLRAELADLTAGGGTAGGTGARIAELRELIDRAEVVVKPDDGLVEPGMIITVRYEDDAEASSFLLGDRELQRLDPSLDLDVYSPDSPLGLTINGHYPGDTVSYTTPTGVIVKLTITAAVPFA